MTAAPIQSTGATFSPCRRYRYALMRTWDVERRACAFVGFNPSTADAFDDDPTIRRCIGLARKWGFGGLVMLNLFAFRSTDPREIARQVDPVGPMNDAAIRAAVRDVGKTVVAWGDLAEPYRDRARDVLRMCWLSAFRGPVQRLGPTTNSGHPRHPLYQRRDAGLNLYPDGSLG